MRFFTPFILCLTLSGCVGNPPPNLTPAAQTAYYQTQIVKDLDLLRDAVVDANALVPSLVSTQTTTLVVKYHELAITLVNNAPLGWKVDLSIGLTGLLKTLPANEQRVVSPYVTLIQVALQVIS